MKKVSLRRNAIVPLETNPTNATAEQAKSINKQIQKRLADDTADEFEENKELPPINHDEADN